MLTYCRRISCCFFCCVANFIFCSFDEDSRSRRNNIIYNHQQEAHHQQEHGTRARTIITIKTRTREARTRAPIATIDRRRRRTSAKNKTTKTITATTATPTQKSLPSLPQIQHSTPGTPKRSTNHWGSRPLGGSEGSLSLRMIGATPAWIVPSLTPRFTCPICLPFLYINLEVLCLRSVVSLSSSISRYNRNRLHSTSTGGCASDEEALKPSPQPPSSFRWLKCIPQAVSPQQQQEKQENRNKTHGRMKGRHKNMKRKNTRKCIYVACASDQWRNPIETWLKRERGRDLCKTQRVHAENQGNMQETHGMAGNWSFKETKGEK